MEIVFSNFYGNHKIKLVIKDDGLVYTSNGKFIGNKNSEYFEEQLQMFKDSYREPAVDYDVDWDYLYA